MSLEKKLLEEVKRYKNINNYIQEQDELPPLPDEGGSEETTDDLTPTPQGSEDMSGAEEVPEPVDIETDPDVEVVGDEGIENEMSDEEGTEELDVTELVNTQKDISDKQDEYMEGMFSKLEDLTSKLGEMDTILNKINDLEQKVEKYRQKSPEEKLQLRSLDSYPYNQKLSDFFIDKQDEFEKTGKNEYVLTSDEVENYSDGDIKKSFDRPFEDEEGL
jgi:fructose-specific phosphotransferase system component IIB